MVDRSANALISIMLSFILVLLKSVSKQQLKQLFSFNKCFSGLGWSVLIFLPIWGWNILKTTVCFTFSPADKFYCILQILNVQKCILKKIPTSGTYTSLEFRKFQPQYCCKEDFFLRFTARYFFSLFGVHGAQYHWILMPHVNYVYTIAKKALKSYKVEKTAGMILSVPEFI